MPSHKSRRAPSVSVAARRRHGASTGPAAAPGRLDRVSSYLVLVARQSGAPEASQCGYVLRRLSHLPRLRATLQKELGVLNLSEAAFRALVLLYSRDPTPVSLRDLACLLGCPRSSARRAAEHLGSLRWLLFSESSGPGPEELLGLSEEGRRHAALAIYRYLQCVVRFYDELVRGKFDHVT